jgi:ABC-type nitrate/sulfonate/bicarbonate transport system substrate-binding protein
MITALNDKSIDVSIALTESLIAGIAKGAGTYKLVGNYVSTPLNWAVITGAKSKYNSIDDLRGAKIGISRIGRYCHNSILPPVLVAHTDRGLLSVARRLWLLIWP